MFGDDKTQEMGRAGVPGRNGLYFLKPSLQTAFIYRMNEFRQPELIEIDKHWILNS